MFIQAAVVLGIVVLLCRTGQSQNHIGIEEMCIPKNIVKADEMEEMAKRWGTQEEATEELKKIIASIPVQIDERGYVKQRSVQRLKDFDVNLYHQLENIDVECCPWIFRGTVSTAVRYDLNSGNVLEDCYFIVGFYKQGNSWEHLIVYASGFGDYRGVVYGNKYIMGQLYDIARENEIAEKISKALNRTEWTILEEKTRPEKNTAKEKTYGLPVYQSPEQLARSRKIVVEGKTYIGKLISYDNGKIAIKLEDREEPREFSVTQFTRECQDDVVLYVRFHGFDIDSNISLTKDRKKMRGRIKYDSRGVPVFHNFKTDEETPMEKLLDGIAPKDVKIYEPFWEYMAARKHSYMKNIPDEVIEKVKKKFEEAEGATEKK